MERKAYLQLAAIKAKSLVNNQLIRITPDERYYVYRDNEGRLYIGQCLTFGIKGEETAGAAFFPNREEFKQINSKGIAIGFWQKFMPNRAEAIAHGVNEQSLGKWKAAKKG